MYRRAFIDKISKIKNINIIQKKLKQSLITKKDSFQQVVLNVYKIGKDNTFTEQIVYSGNIFDVLQWCIQKQDEFKTQFDGYLNNIRNNSDKKYILKYTKKLYDFIKQSNLYSDKCFKILEKFINDFSNKQKKLKDSDVVNYLQGNNGIKNIISKYRKIITHDRVYVLKSLSQHYIDDDKKQNYILGISGIQKAIKNNDILKINLKDSGIVRIKPINVKQQKWVLFGKLLDENDNVIKNVIICQSDIKR